MNQPEHNSRTPESRHDIAIVGMACFFPKAPSLAAYWHNITTGVDAIGDAPPANFLHQVYEAGGNANDRVHSLKGGFLETLPPFIPSEFGVIPRAVDGAEPEHFMALQVAHAALIDAGFPELPINREKTEVILGRGTYVNRGFMTAMQHSVVVEQTINLLRLLHPEHSDVELAILKEKLKEQLPPFSPETAPGLCHNLVAGLIANRLDLHGRNLVMDAACASCLLALEIAMDDLSSHKCDAAIVGGVQISTHAPIHMIFSHLGALSHQAHLRPFDQKADGTMLGEGIGMVVIKRLEDAVRDRHRIYAVIKGIGSSSDGKGTGLLAPRLEGEVLALRRAYAAAGIDPATIELIEAHGTGIPLGDITEIKALRTVFGARTDGASPRCGIGTVKSMIGHLIPAAGIAGIIKGALALYHKVLPPTLCCDTPNPDLRLKETPFYINTETRPWIHGHQGYPRRAGVNAFGFGGINAHAVLEEHVDGQNDNRHLQDDWEVELFVFSGMDRAGLLATLTQFLQWLASPRAATCRLADMSYTVNTGRQNGSYRLALVAGDREELNKKGQHACRLLADPARNQIKDRSGIFYFEKPLAGNGKVAFLFPGEGSQYVNMLSDLCCFFPAARACFDLLDRAYTGLAGGRLPSSFIFPPPGDADQAGTRILTMNGAADAVSTANRALFHILGDLGIRPDAVAGHSSGELAALEAAGAVKLTGEEEVLSYIRIGNSIIDSLEAADDIPHGKLLAVGGVDAHGVEQVIQATRDFLCLSMDNCPHQFVLCGTDQTIAKAEKSLRSQGAICQVLPFQRAYHTGRFQPALKRLRRLYEAAPFRRPEIPLYSCLTAERYPDEAEAIRGLALEQWVKPVRFQQTISRMHADGIRIFLEVGPRANLTGFVHDILKDQPHCAIATNVHHRSGLRQLLHALALAAAHGVPMQLSGLYRHRQVTRLELTAQTLPEKAVKGITLNRDLPLLQLEETDLSFLHRKSLTPPSAAGNDPVGASIPGSRPLNPVLDEYFQTMEHFLTIQQQTMESILSSGGQFSRPAPQAPAPVPGPAAKTPPSVELPSTPAQPPTQEVSTAPIPADQSAAGIKTLLLGLVSERTGYPQEMLTMDQDMEAELGIDSIKRVEILGALVKELKNFDETRSQQLNRLRTLGEIIRFLEEPPGPPHTQKTEADTITFQDHGERIEIHSVLDLDKDIFLRDHTLGGPVSRDNPDLHGLAVMPFAMSLEIMAEAASELFPGMRVSGFNDLKSRNWIIFKARQMAITVTAQKTEKADQALIRLFIGTGQSGAPAMEGTIFFSELLPQERLSDQERAPADWSSKGIPEQFYPLALFHGPAFRNVGGIRQWGEAGAEADLAIQHHIPLFHNRDVSGLSVAPLHVDAAGQVVGLWAAHFITDQYVIFPVAVEEIRFYAAGMSSSMQCLTSSATEEDAIRSDIILAHEDGRIGCRIRGLRHKRINMPEAVHHFRGSREVMLSRPWEPAPDLPGDGARFSCSLLPAGVLDFTGADGEVLREVIAHIILGKDERKIWYDLPYPEPRRTEWLLARLAGKEAIRRLLGRQGCADAWPADITIVSNEQGQPQVTGSWLAGLGWMPQVSLSHTQGSAAAIAARLHASEGIGIDIELFRQPDAAFSQTAFTLEEQSLLAGLKGDLSAEWQFRMWCAREAAMKAMGGVLNQTLNLTTINRQNGTIDARIKDADTEEERTLPVISFQQDGFIGAICVFTNIQENQQEKEV